MNPVEDGGIHREGLPLETQHRRWFISVYVSFPWGSFLMGVLPCARWSHSCGTGKWGTVCVCLGRERSYHVACFARHAV